MKTYTIMLAGLVLSGCTDETAAKKALDAHGFTDIHFTGYEVMACSDDDKSHTGFTAKNPKGLEVKGVVCCGWIKSCTVRF